LFFTGGEAMFGEQFAILIVEGEFEGFGVDLDAVDKVGFTEQVEEVFGDLILQVVEFVEFEFLLK
jgi:hypothetical protein